MIFFRIIFCFFSIFFFVFADQKVFQINHSHSNNNLNRSPDYKQKIAIIGAGAGGSSAAYHLQKYSNNSFDITVYERNSYIGGRSKTITPSDGFYNDLKIELGASVFVKENKILYEAAKKFGLELVLFGPNNSNFDSIDYPSSGIWDGVKFTYLETTNTYWDKIKLFLKYGLDFIRFKNVWYEEIKIKFLKIYQDSYFPFNSLLNITLQLNLTETLTNSGYEFLKSKKISDSFINNFVSAATRTNYAQDPNNIHALESLVSLSTNDAFSVKGGNWQIFKNFINNSNAKLLLNTTVSNIFFNEKNNDIQITSNLNGTKYIASYDQVIIATPIDLSNITLSNFNNEINFYKVDYVCLYVTLIISSQRVNGKYFNLKSSEVPNSIYTGWYNTNRTELPFNTIELLEYLPTKEYLYKIFSLQPVSNKLLVNLFQCKNCIKWIHEKNWLSYPYLSPTLDFNNIRLDNGLYYLNGMEQFISTMETMALAGSNVAKIISNHL